MLLSPRQGRAGRKIIEVVPLVMIVMFDVRHNISFCISVGFVDID